MTEDTPAPAPAPEAKPDPPPEAKAKPKRQKPRSPFETFMAAAQKLTVEERNRALGMGIILPYLVEPDSLVQEPTYGYYCLQCGEIGLFFIGTEFQHTDGTVVREVPVSIPARFLPWIQPALNAHDVDRHKPICQVCHQTLDLINGHFRIKRVVHIRPWRDKRDEAFQKMRQMRFKNVPVSYPKNTADQPRVPNKFSQEGQFADTEANREAGIAGQPYMEGADREAIEAVASSVTDSKGRTMNDLNKGS